MGTFLYRKLLRMCVLVCPEELKQECHVLLAQIDNTNPMVLTHIWDEFTRSRPSGYGANGVIVYFLMLRYSKLNKERKLRIEQTILTKQGLPGYWKLIQTLLFFLAESPLKICLLFH